MEYSKGSSKREVYTDKCVIKKRKISNNPTLYLKELEKEEQMKPNED